MEQVRSEGPQILSEVVFYDLGSGLGKLVIAAGSLNWVHKSVGIEIVKEIAADADIVLSKILEGGTPVLTKAALKCVLKQGDYLNFSSEWVHADIIYICSAG